MKKRLLFYWVIPIAIATIIFYFSAQPAEVSTASSQSVGDWLLSPFRQLFGASFTFTAEMIDFYLRKLAHFLSFSALGGSLYHAISATFIKKKNLGIISALLGLCYAASDELHQFFVPGRSCRMEDVILDFAGVYFGILLVYLAHRILRKKRGH